MAGVGLIEVLIAIVILAFGMLGVAALQAASLRNGQSALERSQATVETYAILDAMRANRASALIGLYNLDPMTCDAPDLDPANLVANDQHNWITSLKSRLGPAACGDIVCATLACTITVQWDDSRGTTVNSLAEQTKAQTYTVVTTTRL